MANDERDVNSSQWNEMMLDKIEIALSVDRFAKYIDACGGDREAAFLLYGWNTAVSAAFYVPLQTVEVILRNTLHDALSAQYGLTWHDSGELGLDAYAIRKISQSKRSLLEGEDVVVPSRMAANLSFGSWCLYSAPEVVCDSRGAILPGAFVCLCWVLVVAD